MARGAIAVGNSTPSGTELPDETDGDATNFHTLVNSGKTRLLARNSGATPRVVTVYISKTVQGKAVSPITKTVAAGKTVSFGPFPVADFGALINVDVAHAEIKLRGLE